MCKSAISESLVPRKFKCIWYIYIYVRTLSKQVLQLHKLGGYSGVSLMAALCAEWHIALQLRSTLFSGFLRYVAFLPQTVCRKSIGFCHSRRAPSPTLLCTGAMRSGQLFSIRIVRRFTLRALQLYKCWMALCWCTK